MRLLLADDDPHMQALLSLVLTKRGHAVEAFADGEAVWAAFEREPAAMLVLDWHMPGLDGLEVCRRVRAHPEGAHAYLLVITASGGMQSLEAVLEAGADDYVPKPVTPADVAARLRIAERRIADGAARRAAESDLRQARYLAGIGELSLALQHEINNPLAALLAHTALLKAGVIEPDELAATAETIEAQARRVAEVVKRIAAPEAARTVEYVEGRRMLDLQSGGA